MVSVPIPDLELGAELGRGAHGVVLRGQRGDRSYAVKVPLEALAPSERGLAYRRFLREAAALARVHHPALPAVLEVGRVADVPYLVMELSIGETLADRLEREQLTESEAIFLVAQLASALDAIHGAGLLHRDVKPRNIVFDAATGATRLVDLGSAIVAHGDSSLEVTPAYAAPEVLRGGPSSGDVRADLYSLGRVLEEATDTGRTRALSVGRPPAELGQRSPGLAHILAHLVAVDPQERYETAAQALADMVRLFPAETAQVTLVPRNRERLLGRDSELDRLRRTWAEAQRGGRVIVVRGSPGSGKTHLLRTFAADLSSVGVRTLWAACHPRDPRAFTVVRQLVEGYLKGCDSLPPELRARSFADVQRLAGDVGSLLKLLSPYLARVLRGAPTVAGSENVEQAFSEGLSDFLGKLLCSLDSACVFVDDAQWLDPGSLRVLMRAINVTSDSRVLFVLSLREGELPREVSRLLQAISIPVTELSVSRLGDDDVIDLVRDYLAAPELDEEVKHAVLRLSEGMPLRALEVVRAFVDEGALLPHWGRWQLDRGAAMRMHLPSETTSLLRRRIDVQDERTRAVLTLAAVVGMVFEEDLVAAAAPFDHGPIREAMVEGLRSELIEEGSDGQRRFIHHTVREALLAACPLPELAAIHQRIAEALDDREGSTRVPASSGTVARGTQTPDNVAFANDGADADQLYRVAFHFASGIAGRTPERAASACIRAAQAAFARFDNTRAAEFLIAADSALGNVSRTLEPQHRLMLAEARVRAGSLDEARREFEQVLTSTDDKLVQCTALARIASIHDARFDMKNAWTAIEAAFQRLGETAPTARVGYVARTVEQWAGRRLARLLPAELSAGERARLEALASLYAQASRVALNANEPAKVILGTLRALRIAERLGPSAALANSYLSYSFVLTVLGASGRGAAYVARADEIARTRGDPVLHAHVLQGQSVVAVWGGRVQEAVKSTARALTEYGNWAELSEYCVNCSNLGQIETVRGRCHDAWKWVDLAIQRVNRHDGAPVVHEQLLLCAHAVLVALGREGEVSSRLRRLAQVAVPAPKDGGAYAMTFGARVGVFTEKMELGAQFEALVEEFESLGQNPRRVHLSVTEYYIHVAHARVHACLRAPRAEREPLLARLDTATTTLEAAAKIDLIVAHHRAVLGYREWLRGRPEEAAKSFDEAERLGVAEAAPWVLYAVHRGRAHMFRDQGRLEAARDQAVLAESLAFDHGAAYRVRFIREEFSLRPRVHTTESPFSTSPLDAPRSSDEETTNAFFGAGRARRQLRALLRISQARAQELSPDHQARLVVDEVVHALRAERGLLFLTADVARRASRGSASAAELALEAGRDAVGRDIGPDEDYDRDAVLDAFQGSSEERGQPSTTGRVRTMATRSAVASPLIVDDLTCGVIYVDRPLGDGVFSDADGELLGALSGQVSVALELTRALRARERAEESLRNADKMDAVARLARSIAHDLNNMLSAIRLATVGMMYAPGAKELVGDDVQTIQSALTRANELTRQLGTFSSGGFGKPQQVRFSSRIDRLLPLIRGLVGEGIHVEARITPKLPAIRIDPNQLDQLVMNLAVNAREAMPEGGRIDIELSEVLLDERFVREHPRVEPGRYLRFAISDTGQGMEEEIRRKIFEPYFTTKREQGGAGLGLASVYWVVSQAGGHIEVTSAVGRGTAFTIHLPVERAPGYRGGRRRTILIVDGDPLAARQLEQTLADLGYRVLSASTGPQALELLRDRGDVALVVTVVEMQGMNGFELAHELKNLNERLAVLFVLGADDPTPERDVIGKEIEYLTKPISKTALSDKLAGLLPDGERNVRDG